MADAYTVVLVDKWGHVLERDGTGYRLDSGHPHFEARFAELEQARTFCEGVIRDLPHVECDVFRDGKIVLQHFDAEWRQREEEQIRQSFDAQSRCDQLALIVLGGLVALATGGLIWCLL